MNRFWGRLIAGTTVAAGLALATPGCQHDDSTIFIRAVLAPPTTITNGQCVYTADTSQPIISGGVLDVGLSSSYTAQMLVGNQLTSRASTENVRTETSGVSIQGTTVRITDSDGNQLTSYTRLATGFVDPAAGVTPSYGIVSATLIDPATANDVRGKLAPFATRRLVAYVRAFGKTLGGVDVESNEFEYPVSLCLGCLVVFPADSVDTAEKALTGKLNCDAAASTSSTTSVSACVSGQDQATDCRNCKGSAVCDPNYLSGGVTSTTTADGG